MASFSGSFIPTLTQAIVILASIVSATAYIFSNALFRKNLKDENGNSIPNGPIGLPILGELGWCRPPAFAFLTCLGFDRLFSVSDGLP